MIAQIDKVFIKTSLKKTYTRLVAYFLYEGRPLTTKGRWINPLVFIFYRLQANLPFAKKIINPIFIIGTGRSGTTILGICLGIHKDVGFLNEPKAVWAYAYNKEDLIGSYNLTPASYQLDENDFSILIKNRVNRIYGHFLRISRSNRVVDKYPELVFRTNFVKKVFPDAKFIFLHRDGHSTCSSISHWSERLGLHENNETHDWWGLNRRKWDILCSEVLPKNENLKNYIEVISRYTNHEHMAAVEWMLTMRQGIKISKEFPESVMSLSYDDFVRSPNVRAKVLEFCELAPDPKFDNYCETVLKPTKVKEKLNLPTELIYEFNSVMMELGYE